MFEKILKNAKKDEKKKQQAIEEAKSQEQRDYEAKQREGEETARKTFNSCVNVMREMGWRVLPRFRLVNPDMPEMLVAELDVDAIPFKRWQQINERLEQVKAAKEGRTQDASVPADEKNDAQEPSEPSEGEKTPDEAQGAS